MVNSILNQNYKTLLNIGILSTNGALFTMLFVIYGLRMPERGNRRVNDLRASGKMAELILFYCSCLILLCRAVGHLDTAVID